MTSVGIRELKAHLSRYLKRVKKGESLAVTERGKRLATIVPVPQSASEAQLWELARQGKLHWSGGKPTGLKNLVPCRGKLASEMVFEGRQERL